MKKIGLMIIGVDCEALFHLMKLIETNIDLEEEFRMFQGSLEPDEIVGI